MKHLNSKNSNWLRGNVLPTIFQFENRDIIRDQFLEKQKECKSKSNNEDKGHQGLVYSGGLLLMYRYNLSSITKFLYW